MFDKAEAEYRELSDKKRIVENDKTKIHRVWAVGSTCMHSMHLLTRWPVMHANEPWRA